MLLVVLAAVACGLVAEDLAYAWGSVRLWVPDLVVGWTFVGCGVVGVARRPDSRTGWLLVATGFAWFAGNFVGTGGGAVAWLASTLMFAHRGLLVHSVLSFPTGRLPSAGDRLLVAAAYVLSVSPLARSDVATVVLGIAVVVVAGAGRTGLTGSEHRFAGARLRAAVTVGVALAGTGLLRVAVREPRADQAVLVVYEVALCAAALVLLTGLLRAGTARAELADLVVELTGPPGGSLRQALGRALGDPTTDVGYWSPEVDGYVDAEGRRVPLPEGREDRTTTLVGTAEGPLAVLVHDSSVLDDPGLVEAVAAAASLAGVNARLRADVRARAEEVASSRRRLVEAGDEERTRLLHRLEAGAGSHLDEARAGLATAASALGAPVEGLSARLEVALDQLEEASTSLRELARGLHPPGLERGGLAVALAELARHSVVPVALSVEVDRVPHPVEVAVYFVCAEALANVGKHAGASSVVLTVGRDGGRLRVSVTDDGAGGAPASGAPTEAGSGLRGMADRVDTVGGWITIESPAGGGTRLVAEVPLDDQPG